MENNRQTGATLKPLTQIDEIMLDFEGRESNYMIGLGESDNPPLFGEPVSNSGGGDTSFSEVQSTFLDSLAGTTLLSVAGKLFQSN